MELTHLLSFLAVVLPMAYGAPTQAADELHPEILAAMKRDLGLNAEQAHARVAHDDLATKLITKLSSSIGNDKFAGGWISNGKTFVSVTDAAAVEHVAAAGAVPVLTKNSLTKLKAAKDAIDQHLQSSVETRDEESGIKGIASYFVDVASNKIVVESLADSQDRAHALAARGNLSEGEYEVRVVESLPSAAASVVGGDAYVIVEPKLTCSYGFSVTGGFVSAGHCGQRGQHVTAGRSLGGEAVGQFAGSTFPGADMSYVKTNSNTRLYGSIDNYNGGSIAVRGSQEAAQGASVCRSGATTGVRCGTITGKDQTVILDGTNKVYGLSRSSACCDHGDSGGPFYSGSQGQGVTSATNGECNSGGYSYFQPLNPILQNYGVSLITN